MTAIRRLRLAADRTALKLACATVGRDWLCPLVRLPIAAFDLVWLWLARAEGRFSAGRV